VRDGQIVADRPDEKDSLRFNVWIGQGIQPEQVYLYQARGKRSPFTRIEMSKEKEGEYHAVLPPKEVRAGLRYYVEARSTSTGTTSFFPARTEGGPIKVKVKD